MLVMLIRAAVSADLDAITHLRTERHELLRQSDARFAPLTDNPSTWLTDSAARVWVVEVSERIVAYALLYGERCPLGDLPPQSAALIEMALDAHRYYGGTGSALAKYVREAAPTLWVAVPRFHAVEQAFWRAFGAKRCHADNLPLNAAFEWMCVQ